MRSPAPKLPDKLRRRTPAFEALSLSMSRKAVAIPTHVPARPMIGATSAYRRSACRVSAESFMRLATSLGSSHHETHDLNRSIFRSADETGKVSNEQPTLAFQPATHDRTSHRRLQRVRPPTLCTSRRPHSSWRRFFDFDQGNVLNLRSAAVYPRLRAHSVLQRLSTLRLLIPRIRARPETTR
jgi:hypothetical protein